jgi:hypothetical protein
MEGLVDLRAGLDDVEKKKLLTLPGLELRPLGRPARSQSLYRLRYIKEISKEKIILFPAIFNCRSRVQFLSS